MILTLDLLDTAKQIENKMLLAISTHLLNAMEKAEPNIRKSLVPIIDKAIKNTPEYTSLLTGQLKGEFGLVAPATILERIIGQIASTVEVDLNKLYPRGGKLEGGIEVGILINSNEYAGLQTIHNTTYLSNGYPIEWLKWLLLSGYAVVNNFHIVEGPFPQSRSRKAIMIEGGQWALISNRVPDEFIGYPGNNFLTRGLDQVTDQIANIIQQEFIKKV